MCMMFRTEISVIPWRIRNGLTRVSRRLGWTDGVPRDLSAQIDVHYGPHPRQVLTVLRSRKSTELAPGIVVIHGGGWTEGDKTEMDVDWAHPLARHGFVVANVEYRTAEHAVAPAAILDVRTAVMWVHRHAASLGIDRNRVALLGASAGGHLALMAALPPTSDPELGDSSTPVSVVSLWGVTDVEDIVNGRNVKDFAHRWIPGHLRDSDTLKRWSPVFWATPQSPQVLIVHARGDQSVPFSHAELLKHRLGNQGEFVAIDRNWHAVPNADYDWVFGKVLSYLKETLK